MITASRELSRAEVTGFIVGSMNYRGDGDTDIVQRALRSIEWYKAIEGRGSGPILYCLVHDIGTLLIRGEQFSFRTLHDYEDIPESARDVRLNYENAFLNTLLRDPGFTRARSAFMRDPSRDKLIIRIIQCILGPVIGKRKPGYQNPPGVNPQLLREMSFGGRLKDVDQAEAFQSSYEEGFFERALRETLAILLSRDWYLSESDLAEIEHWDAFLGREDLRMSARRIMHHAARIRPADRRRFPMVDEDPEVDSELSDAGFYPTGGFSELSTQGRPENLVPSELIYLGEGNILGVSPEELELLQKNHEGEGTPTIVDLFTFRFLSRELLYFMRDSGTLKRVRRTVHFVLEPDPKSTDADDYQGLRWREPGLVRVKDRLVVIMLGLAVRLAQDFGIIFSGDSVRLDIHILARNAGVRREAERDAQLLRVLLEHEIKHEKVTVQVEREFPLRESQDKARRVYGLSVQYKDLEAPGLEGPEPCPKFLKATILKLGGEQHELAPENVNSVAIPLNESFLESIEQARDDLLSEITGSRKRR